MGDKNIEHFWNRGDIKTPLDIFHLEEKIAIPQPRFAPNLDGGQSVPVIYLQLFSQKPLSLIGLFMP